MHAVHILVYLRFSLPYLLMTSSLFRVSLRTEIFKQYNVTMFIYFHICIVELMVEVIILFSSLFVAYPLSCRRFSPGIEVYCDQSYIKCIPITKIILLFRQVIVETLLHATLLLSISLYIFNLSAALFIQFNFCQYCFTCFHLIQSSDNISYSPR